MPSFAGQLSPADIANVAAYVSSSRASNGFPTSIDAGGRAIVPGVDRRERPCHRAMAGRCPAPCCSPSPSWAASSSSPAVAAPTTRRAPSSHHLRRHGRGGVRSAWREQHREAPSRRASRPVRRAARSPERSPARRRVPKPTSGAEFGATSGAESGATSGAESGATSVASSAAASRPAAAGGDATAGKAVFMSAGCVGCHTLADAAAAGNVGPNLDEAKPPFDLVVDRVNDEGAMPAFGAPRPTSRTSRPTCRRSPARPPSPPCCRRGSTRPARRAVFLDLDGTIVNMSRAVPAAAPAIARVDGACRIRDRAHVRVASRRFELGVAGPIVCYQGALIGEP